MATIPYPTHFDIDTEAERNEQRYSEVRNSLDPSDVLSEVQSLMLAIARDEDHPLWSLVQHCTRIGTTQETGTVPHMAPYVGEAFIPLIDKAIQRLVGETLDDFSAWEVD